MKKLLLLLIAFTIMPPMLAMKAPTKKINPSKQRKKQRKELNRKLRKAIVSNDLLTIELFIKQGANPNTKDYFDHTALHVAAKKHSLALCKLLLERGADVNTQDKAGVTPLMQAIDLGSASIDVCKLLINHDADVNIATDNGDTALLCASTCHYGTSVALRKLLLDQGADLRARKYQHTPLKNSHFDMAEMKILITHSRFYPYYTSEKLRHAQHMTRARLWAMQSVCPFFIPKDIKEMILAYHKDEDVWHDACATPLKLHTKKYGRIPLMPLTVLKTLVKHDALELEKTAVRVRVEKCKILEPLVHDCVQNGNPKAREFIKKLLEGPLWEELKDVIRADLDPANSGWSSLCLVQ